MALVGLSDNNDLGGHLRVWQGRSPLSAGSRGNDSNGVNFWILDGKSGGVHCTWVIKSALVWITMTWMNQNLHRHLALSVDFKTLNFKKRSVPVRQNTIYKQEIRWI